LLLYLSNKKIKAKQIGKKKAIKKKGKKGVKKCVIKKRRQ
jgi:hypothetical protein